MEKVDRKLCPVCGNRFYAAPSQEKRLKSGKVLTCSKKCSGILRSGQNNSNWKPKIEKQCPVCKKYFLVHQSIYQRKKYCSKSCQINSPKKHTPPAKSIAGWKPHNWKGGEIERECESCHKKFKAKRAAVAKGQARFCSRQCWSREMVEIMRGRQHSTARGGKRDDLGGQYFRSSWEANYARYLNWLVSIQQIKSWEFEPDTFEFFTIKRGNRFYTPDFKVFDNNGNFEYHEIKGYMDTKSKTKLSRMSKFYPNIKVILVDSDGYKAISRQVKNFIPNWETVDYH
jgi:hypothetical protein